MEFSAFYNSIDKDRVYGAKDWANYFKPLIRNGVFPNPSNGLQVVASSGMTVKVKVGQGWIEGHHYMNGPTEDLAIELANADGVLKRYDRIVLQSSELERRTVIKVKSSAFSQQPTPPPLQQDAEVYELCLADILVSNGVTEITQSAIKDQRFDTTLCGIVVSLIDKIDFSVLTSQFDEYFKEYTSDISLQYSNYINAMEIFKNEYIQEMNDFLEQIKNQLSEDPAGNLQLQLNELKDRVPTVEIGQVTTQKLYPCCKLYKTNWAYGMGGAGVGAYGGEVLENIPFNTCFDEYSLTISVPEKFKDFTTINPIDERHVAFSSSTDPTQTLLLVMEV